MNKYIEGKEKLREEKGVEDMKKVKNEKKRNEKKRNEKKRKKK
jgi:hypothetical protein